MAKEKQRSLRSRSTRHARLAEWVYPANLYMPLHRHATAHLSIVLSGAFKEKQGSKVFEAVPGTVLFRPRNSEHAVRFGSIQTRILSVHLTNVVSDYAQLKVPLQKTADLTGTRSNWIAARLYDEFRRKDPASELAVDALILDLLVELDRNGREPDAAPPMKRIEDLLRKNVQSKPRLEQLAKAVGMHPASLSRAFRKTHGCTIGVFVRRLRLKRATELLAKSEMTLAEIARELGFADQSHFSRTFKSETGFSPKLCQRAHRES